MSVRLLAEMIKACLALPWNIDLSYQPFDRYGKPEI